MSILRVHGDQDHYPGPTNSSFETGNLEGWAVISGNAFGNASVRPIPSSLGRFKKASNYLSGNAESGNTAIGKLRSSSFQANSAMSFLISGGWDPLNLFVGLIRASDDAPLMKQTGLNDDMFVRIVWDTSAWTGVEVYILVHNTSASESWGHINLADVRTGADAIGDGKLTFNLLGQVNQPAEGTLPAAELYAADPFRPQFHYTPYQGWINDPAGLIQWKGRHHLFSQFFPDAPIWGPMHWSHADSSNGVHWRNLPVALYPAHQNPLDASGRYTGSAVADNNDEMLLIFTDSVDRALYPEAIHEFVSAAKSTDGVSFQVNSKNPIIATPPDGSPTGFRDPKIFKDPIDGKWKMVVGSGDTTSGKVQLYSSTDLLNWSYTGVLAIGDGGTGIMWECPNFFPLDDKWVLFYGGGNCTGWYEIGTYDGSTFKREKLGLLDAGPDSYAMQYYKDESGRNLAITWMGNWDLSKWPTRVNGWAGAQSITRELFLRADGGLGSKPIKEVQSLANGSAQLLGQTEVRGTVTVGTGNTARLELSVDLVSTDAPTFDIALFCSSAESLLLTYTVATRTLTLDTTNAGYGHAGTWHAILAPRANDILALDLLIDRSSLEIFAEDGTVMTVAVYPRYKESTGIVISTTEGKAVFNSIVLTPFGSIWSKLNG